MNSRERVHRAITYQHVDRIPAGLFGTTAEYEQRLAGCFGLGTREAMYRQQGIDVWHTGGPSYKGPVLQYKGRPADILRDMYWENNPQPPFADVRSIDEVLSYPIPSLDDFDGTALDLEIRNHEEFALCTGINAAIFHNFLYLCGQENALCLLKEEPDIALAIVNHITGFWNAYLARTLDIAAGRGVLVENCNDFGTQHSMFISGEDFRRFFKPSLRLFCETAHNYRVFYMQHSCGDVSPILDDYVEIGVDVLNPIQVQATDMELASVVSRFQGRLAFYGGIDTQVLLPQGSEDAIRSAVSAAVSLFGSGGGFILSGSQGLMDDIPLAHAAAMLDCRLRTFE